MKKIFFICIAVLTSTILFAQQSDEHTSLAIGVDSDVWLARGAMVFRDNNITRRLPQGTIVLGDWTSFRWQINGIFEDISTIEYEGNRYAIRTSSLRPITGGRLPEDWVTPPDAEKGWTLLYFLEALHSQDRGTVLNYEQEWADWIERWRQAQWDVDNDEWWRGLGIDDVTSLIFFDAVVSIGGFSRRTSFIQDIIPYSTGYIITLNSIPADPNDPSLPPSSLPFPFSSERPNFDLIFIPDGDYMDVYLDTLNNHFATFVNIDVALLEELGRFIRTNTVDLSIITSWPRRADGRMDVPPPSGVRLAFRATHTTMARLNVRDTPATTANLVTTLELDAEVQILETGYMETIGDITAPWIRILSANGFTGWVFSGFLETVAVESAAGVEYQPAQAPAVFVPQVDDVVTSGMPLWILLAVAGGVAAVGMALVVRRKRG